MPRRRGSTRGARGTPGRGSLRSSPRRQSHSVVDTSTPGSQSHTMTPGSQSHTATPGSQLDSHTASPESQSHTRRRSPRRQNHRSTPATLRTGRIQKNTRSRTRRQVSYSHNRGRTPLNRDTSPSSSASGDEETSEYSVSSYNTRPAQSETTGSVTPRRENATQYRPAYE